jgi:hypothetical protein
LKYTFDPSEPLTDIEKKHILSVLKEVESFLHCKSIRRDLRVLGKDWGGGSCSTRIRYDRWEIFIGEYNPIIYPYGVGKYGGIALEKTRTNQIVMGVARALIEYKRRSKAFKLTNNDDYPWVGTTRSFSYYDTGTLTLSSSTFNTKRETKLAELAIHLGLISRVECDNAKKAKKPRTTGDHSAFHDAKATLESFSGVIGVDNLVGVPVLIRKNKFTVARGTVLNTVQSHTYVRGKWIPSYVRARVKQENGSISTHYLSSKRVTVDVDKLEDWGVG